MRTCTGAPSSAELLKGLEHLGFSDPPGIGLEVDFDRVAQAFGSGPVRDALAEAADRPGVSERIGDEAELPTAKDLTDRMGDNIRKWFIYGD